MNEPPITQATLENEMCDEEGCLNEDHLLMEQDCHPGAKVIVIYTKSVGELSVHCSECDNTARFLLAKDSSDAPTPS